MFTKVSSLIYFVSSSVNFAVRLWGIPFFLFSQKVSQRILMWTVTGQGATNPSLLYQVL